MKRLEIRNVSKYFGANAALSKVGLDLPPGRIYGLLGRNGAGKTTLLNLISNRLFPDEGAILVDGENVRENDRALAGIYCMAEAGLFPEGMKVSEVFQWTRAFYPSFDMETAMDLSAKFGLDTGKRMKALSTGYNSILKVITALCSNADIILLDEPVLGMDANHRDQFYKELLVRFGEHPGTIVISTHLIDEAATLFDDVIIIKDGKILLTENTAALSDRGWAASGPAEAVDGYVAGKDVLAVEHFGGLKTAYLITDSGPEAPPDGVALSRLDLQKLFIYLTNA